jgi:hypothetical protein
MTKNRIIGILAIPIVYFGLILMITMFAAIGLVEEIPVWSLWRYPLARRCPGVSSLYIAVPYWSFVAD